MSASTTGPRQAGQKMESRAVMINALWDLCANRSLLKDTERLLQIKEGFSADLFQVVRVTFGLQERSFQTLFDVSISTLKRHGREQRPLNPVASERLDRVFAICHLAQVVFESREAAVEWMLTPNRSLGTGAPIMLCETEIGARQICRVLKALEWGGAA